MKIQLLIIIFIINYSKLYCQKSFPLFTSPEYPKFVEDSFELNRAQNDIVSYANILLNVLSKNVNYLPPTYDNIKGFSKHFKENPFINYLRSKEEQNKDLFFIDLDKFSYDTLIYLYYKNKININNARELLANNKYLILSNTNFINKLENIIYHITLRSPWIKNTFSELDNNIKQLTPKCCNYLAWYNNYLFIISHELDENILLFDSINYNVKYISDKYKFGNYDIISNDILFKREDILLSLNKYLAYIINFNKTIINLNTKLEIELLKFENTNSKVISALDFESKIGLNKSKNELDSVLFKVKQIENIIKRLDSSIMSNNIERINLEKNNLILEREYDSLENIYFKYLIKTDTINELIIFYKNKYANLTVNCKGDNKSLEGCIDKSKLKEYEEIVNILNNYMDTTHIILKYIIDLNVILLEIKNKIYINSKRKSEIENQIMENEKMIQDNKLYYNSSFKDYSQSVIEFEIKYSTYLALNEKIKFYLFGGIEKYLEKKLEPVKSKIKSFN